MNFNLTTVLLLVVLSASGLGIILVGVLTVILSPKNVQERISGFVETSEDRRARASHKTYGVNELRGQVNTFLSVVNSEKIRLRLSRANWQMTDTEFILIRFFAAILGFIPGWFIANNILGGIGLAVAVYVLPGILLSRSIYLRQKQFQDQLIDALVLIRGAVKSGYSLLQAISVVTDEMSPPASEEFGRVIREAQYGIPLGQALRNLSYRMENDDLHMIVTAIIINNEVGGNLSTMLTAVTETIRARVFLFGEVRALTSYARYAGNFLTLLPFLTGLFIFLITPDYFENAWDSPISQIIFIIAGFGIILGNIWMRRIMRFDF